ncbi:MAG: Fpg/Nei family DNA glycosylase, partial [Actinomycetota bacterium]|nr:Fpg/Nei family DNA glycosylase [Actinomycetota bacterium]
LLRPGEKNPKSPAFALDFEGGLAVVLTEGGAKKRAGVWLLERAALAAELAHLGPEPFELDQQGLEEILAREPRRLHALLRDQRAVAGIGRAWANEILHRAQLSPFAISTQLGDTERRRLLHAIVEELERGTVARTRGATDAKTHRIHGKLGEACYVCGTPIARVDYEEHTVYYCPECQTGGRILKDRRLSRLLR